VKRAAWLLVAGLPALCACGGGDSERADREAVRTGEGATTAPGEKRAGDSRTPGTRITVRGSDFGSMLWGPGRQAIYVFQRDGRGRSRCFGECAKAWPPVFTKGRPLAGRGVRKPLLGTTRRRGGRLQVTYAGKPLYYYAHEGPGQVLCHNVDLNGGLWWVVAPTGERRS
jgi:predicted lipoprotein with Yx(FWY)xxD motif